MLRENKKLTRMNLLFKYIGYLLIFLSLAFLIREIVIHGSAIREQLWNFRLFMFSIGAGILYNNFLVLLTFSWHLIVRNEEKIKFRTTYFIYSRSQIAKYLPGNVFHYAGRQLLGYKAGLKQHSIAVATGIETILSVVVAIGISICGILMLGFSKEKLGLLIGIEALVLSSILFSLASLPLVSRHFPFLQNMFGRFATFGLTDWLKAIAVPFLLYTIGFILVGILLWIVAVSCFEVDMSYLTFIAFISVFAMAWVLGFITPGAPGGVGVREAILIGGLSPFISPPKAVAISIAARFIAIAGDVFFYLSSYFGKKGKARERDKIYQRGIE